ncbi:MAG: DNA gyrase subunit A [Deltaproteobacteria bacterium]|jgi:DNA gyrase subunit A|nr:DNA gyrase subunit A [Deltaproteobacteria bacterium]
MNNDHENEKRSNVIPINISEEMQKSFLDYSMSVIVSRALPDVRDGLKPVHRRILYTMHILKNTPNSSYKKSARIVGDAMGRFHPHGDSAIYDALVRLSQDFSMRYPLVDGQGNFGSIDGDPAAAMRYTEVRMDKISLELLRDIEKNTVNFVPNYDEKEMEPTVLPTRIPNLLINGVSGIAVGMATNIPPHNLTEIVNALLAQLEDPDIDLRGLMQFVKGPDFPTGGIIFGRKGIWDAFNTGRGRVVMRGKVEIEERAKKRQALIVSEIPYQVNKAKLIMRIAELVKEKILDGITDIRDESDKRGMRIVIMLRSDAIPEIIENKLYKHTRLQKSFSSNMIAINSGRPSLMNLKKILARFLQHRKDVIVRRTRYELNRALKRKEIVEGLGVASMDIDEVIELIKSSANPEEAEGKLMNHNFTGYGKFLERAKVPKELILKAPDPYLLNNRQAKAILAMRLHRLTGLQQEKLADEFKELTEKIIDYRSLLGDPLLLKEKIKEELIKIRDRYGDERKTIIIEASGELGMESLIDDARMVITLTKKQYIKRTPSNIYRAQRRGGKGRKGAVMRDDEDTVTQVLVASAHKTILFFTNSGRVFKKKVYNLPEGNPNSRGKNLINFLGLQKDEKIVAMLPVPDLESKNFIFFCTRNGIVKKTQISYYSNINKNGIIAIKIDEGDKLINARITDGSQHIILSTKNGYAIRFPETKVRSMGRATRGVIGINLRSGDEVVELSVFDPNDEQATVLSVSTRGFGKRSPAEEYTPHNRGGKGMITLQTSKRNGPLASSMIVHDEDHLIALTRKGIIIRLEVAKIRVQSRNTQGVTLMKLAEDDLIRDISLVQGGEDRIEDENSYDDSDQADSTEQEDRENDVSNNEESPKQLDDFAVDSSQNILSPENNNISSDDDSSDDDNEQ